MPLAPFKNEAEFRVKWIGPFLSKLGYIHVTLTHGSGEQGKDFLFADHDRFDNLRFYAVQAKLGNVGAGDVELDKLLNQASRCFTVRLRFHKDSDERGVSAVYIMASGTISKEAREYISDWCKKTPFGENVYFLDGGTLDRLDKYAFHRIDQELRTRLAGLLGEANFNAEVINWTQQGFREKKVLFDRCRHVALDSLLTAPPPNDLLNYQLMLDASKYIALVNKLADYHLFPFTTSDTEWERRLEIVKRAWEQNLRVRDAADDAIKQLDERYSINVEVVEGALPKDHRQGA